MTDKLPIDQTERLAAINPAESIILQAPAGSGKTEILIQRYLKLLTLVTYPEEVVALTFTNKAANEMLERVLRELKGAKLKRPAGYKAVTGKLAQEVLKQDKANDWNLLDNPRRLQIKTFDSLCLSIVRRAPLLGKNNGIDTPTEDAVEIYQATVQRTLYMLEETGNYADALKTILKHLMHDITSFRQLMVDVLAKRDQWLRLGLGTVDENNLLSIKAVLANSWQQLKKNKVLELQNTFTAEQIRQFVFFDNYANSNLALQDKREITEYGSSIDNTLNCFKRWASFSFTGAGGVRKTVDKRQGFPVANLEQKHAKQDFLEFLQSLKENKSLLELWQNVVSLPDAGFDENKWHLTEAILLTLKLALANLKLEFNSRSEVDYVEIAQAANLALGEISSPSNLALYFDNKISHILIDEFQDTNHSQFEFLEKLTLGWSQEEAQTLFIVGDPMQSIYGFREADVGLFLKVKANGINDIKLKYINLKANFRSSSDIVSWVNDNFKTIFPAVDDYLSGSISYIKSSAFNQKPGRGVKLHGFYSEDSREENLKLVTIVKSELSAYRNHPEKKIAILARSRGHLAYISHLLKLAGVKYLALEMNKLGASQIVEDLRSLSRAYLHLADKAAWLAILRAPWCGLKLVDLQVIVDMDPQATVWELVTNHRWQSKLGTDAKTRLDQVVGAFHAAFNHSGGLEAEEIIEKLWHELGGNKYIKEHENLEAQMFFTCLKKAKYSWGIALDKLDYELKKFYMPELTDESCQLECMTIHRAKGLEFATVILPMLGQRKPGKSQDLIRWSEHVLDSEHSHNLLVAPVKSRADKTDSMYDYLGNINTTKVRYEEMRVLYVAATRAKERLHLMATKKSKDSKAPANSLLSFLEQAFVGKYTEVDIDTSDVTTIAYPKLRRRKFDNFKPRNIEYPVYEKVDYALFNKTDIKITAGIVFHAVCEQIARVGIDAIKSEVVDGFITKKLKGAMITLAQFDYSYALIKQAVENMLGDKTGRWILSGQHARSEQELRLSSIKDGKTSQVILDQVVMDNDTIWVIDYKLSYPNETETLEEFTQRMDNEYRAQLYKYKSLLTQIYPGTIKTMLYFPLVPAAYELL